MKTNNSTTIKIIALDRDGVINYDSPDYIKSPEEWHAIPGSLEAIAKFNRLGYQVVVVTNQSGIARGYFDLDTLNKINQKMSDQLKEAGGKIDAIFFCPHGPDDNCECRKPKSGLLLQATDQFAVKPEEIVMIGDSMRDMIAATNCGANTIFIKADHKDKDLAIAKQSGIPIYNSLSEVVEYFYND